MEITTIRIDIAKSVFQFHGVDAAEQTVLQKKLRPNAVLNTLAQLPYCLIDMEACATPHHWAREITALGHDVRLIPPAYVKPYVSGKRMMRLMQRRSARLLRARICTLWL